MDQGGFECPGTSRTGSKNARAHLATRDPEFLRQFGITRVGDITDLDCLGVPVCFAVRPNARGLSVAQGKGLDADQARISAVMEAVEGAVAEDVRRHVICVGSFKEMLSQGQPVIAPETLGRTDIEAFDPLRDRAWVRGISVRTDRMVLAPFELVGIDYRSDMPWDRSAFHMSSEGLAAAFDPDAAILHALLELVENDASVLIDSFETRRVAPKPVWITPGITPALDSLLRHLDGLGLSIEFQDLTTGLGVPVVMASLDRAFSAPSGPGLRRSAGLACRPSAHEAALSALLEAIQSRLTDISGARDDLPPHRFLADRDSFAPKRPLPQCALQDRVVPSSLKSERPLWRSLASHLLAAGIDDIYIFALETGVDGLHVVRVLASGLHTVNPGMQQISTRMLERLISAATPS